ncbi:hypothetical protein D9619_008436 [Psilocybe cf. subviscida]|uniref:TPR-like protein n=1 Tax=Psilocybe cf. subviscida TaxID=2480587 RepID=A0A8H5B9W9_9AGAR|nr:hypothetical protein D9619_008436 [Psilocybe cf. subviscida]
MIELGQRIHESFATVSDNLRNARRVAEDIKETVKDIEVFCEEHKDALDEMIGLCLAVQGLLGKFRDFEISILPMLPQTRGTGRNRLIRGWDAWRNSNKIEGCILDLQSDTLKSAMRTEVKLEAIHQKTSRGFAGITRRLEALEVVPATTTTPWGHRAYGSSGETGDEFNRNVIMFARSTPSTSAPMLRPPDVITEELMTTAYIKLQINNIAMTVDKMSKVPMAAPNNVETFRMSMILDHASMDITRLRHHVVRQVTTIRDLLATPRIRTISIQDSAYALDKLSAALETLGMDQESILVGKWAIALARALVNAYGGGQPDLCANLAHYLLNQSIRYDGSADQWAQFQPITQCVRSNNRFRSLQPIEEAYALTQNLRNQYSGEQFEILHCGVLLQYAGLVDRQRSIEMSVEAIQVLEKIVNIQAFTWSKSLGQIQIERVVQPSSSFFDHLFSSSLPITAITIYAGALQRLGTSWFDMNAWQVRSYTLPVESGPMTSGMDLERLAIAVRRQAVSIHGHEYEVDLASALSFLMKSRTASSISVTDELVGVADECIELLRKLVEKNPLFYARSLIDMLWKKASTLEILDRDLEAIHAWEEVADLAGQIVQDSKMCATALGRLSDQFRRLERHDDAVRTGTLAITTYHEKAETRARRHFYLSRDLRQLRRYKESAEAAQTSVTLYRHLAMNDPETWMGNLTEGLAHAAHCLAASGNYSESLIAWEGSVRMLENFLNTKVDASSAFINSYLAAIRIHKLISFVLGEEEDCLNVSSKAAQHLLWLSQIYPQNTIIMRDLLWAEFCHACNMLLVGRLRDVQQYIDHWADEWSSHPEATSESIIVLCHAEMMNLKALVLDAQGYTEQAWSVTQSVPDIVGIFSTTYRPCFSIVIRSMSQAAQLQVNLGNGEKSLQVAEGVLGLSRDNKLEPIVDTLVWSLHAVALAAHFCRDYKYAAEAAQEGCKLATGSYWRKSEAERNSFLRPSLLAILSSAEANLGRYSAALEGAHRAVNASLDVRGRKADISATTAEQSYMETRGNLAGILLATGDLTQARQICEERHAYYSKRVESRLGEYRELAPILRMLGILYCNEGRHTEGDAAAQELSRIMRMLGSAFPSLQEQVKIRLSNQAEVPILKVLDDMSQKLDCKHQAEIVSLFVIQ